MLRFSKSVKFAGLVISVAFLVLSIYFTFWLQQFTVMYRDLPYQIMNGIQPLSSPASILSNRLLNIWGRTFGFGLLSMRYLMIILTVLTAFCSGIYCFHRTRQLTLCLLLTGIMILESRFFAGPFGWDVPTYLFTTIVLILTLHTQRHKDNAYNYICLGILSAILSLCRLPNVVVVPIILFLIVIMNRKSNRGWILRCCYFYLIAFVASALSLIIVSSGGISNYINSWTTYGLIKEHGAALLIINYISSIHTIVLKFAFFYATISLMKWCDQRLTDKKPQMANCTYYVFFSLLTAYFIRQLYYECQDSEIPLCNLIVAIFFFTICCQLRNKWSYWQIAIVIVLISLVPPAGSNLGLMKTLAVYALPIALTYVRLTKAQVTLVASIYASIVLFFVPMSRHYIFFDKGYPECTAKVDVPLLKDIYMTPDKAELIQTIYNIAKENDFDVLFVGDRSLLFEYLTFQRPAYSITIFSRNFSDSDYINSTMHHVKETEVGNVLVFMEPYCDIMMRRLEKEGYQLVSEHKDFKLYKRAKQ